MNKLNTTQKKQTTQNTAKQNYPGLVASYDSRPGNEVGLFYNAPKPTWGTCVHHKHRTCSRSYWYDLTTDNELESLTNNQQMTMTRFTAVLRPWTMML